MNRDSMRGNVHADLRELRRADRRRRGLSPKTLVLAGGLIAAMGIAMVSSSAFVGVRHAVADDSPGGGFDNYTLRASAGGIQVFASAASGQARAADGGVPWSEATLNYGPTGRALASIAWPGALAGNLGSLLLVSGIPSGIPGVSLPVPLPAPPPIPSQLTPYLPLLNDPIRAEAQTGGDTEVNNSQVPGTLESARVGENTARAEAQLAATLNLLTGKQRSTRTLSQVTLTGPASATAEARSEVLDLVLPGDVVKIQSITSYAIATTDGRVATVVGKTTVAGVTVAGVPVTVDEHGVSVNGSGTGLGALTDAVNKALAQSGITLFIGHSVGKPVGGAVTYDAGSLVIGLPQKITMEIGGAQVGVAALPSGGVQTVLNPELPGPGGNFGGGGTTTTPGSVGTPGGQVENPGSTSTPSGPGPLVARPVASSMALPGGLGWGWVAFVIAGAGLIALGLRRLPDRVLVAGGTACRLTSGANDPFDLDAVDLGEEL